MNRQHRATDGWTKNKNTRCNVASWFGALLLIGTLGAGDARAQTVCQGQPWLGTNGPEVCIEIRDEGTLDTFRQRFQGTSRTYTDTVGTWRFSLTFDYDIGAGGMGMTITGQAWRQLPGTGWLSVRADGGTNQSIPSDTGSLWLEGTATAASGTVLGGGAGYRTPGGDVEFRTFNQTIERTTSGAGEFGGSIDEIPVEEGAVGVVNITGFHVNEVGDLIDIPSGVGYGSPPVSELGLPWTSTHMTSDFLPWETAGTALTGGENPVLVGAAIWSGPSENYVHAYTVEPPWSGPPEVVDQGQHDSGFLFELDACLVDQGHALFSYLKGETSGLNVRILEYDGGEWRSSRIEATVADDYHTASCFKTAHGFFIVALNYTDGTLEIFKRMPDGVFILVETVTASDLGGAPSSPALGAANGSAGYLTTFGPGEKNEAVITVGLDNGTFAVVQLRTDTLAVTGVWNAGPADGGTTSDIVTNGVKETDRGVVGWIVGDELWYADWNLADGPETAEKVLVATMEPGTLFPDYQDISGGAARNGDYNLLADKCYVVGPQKETFPELASYPFRNMGGPIDFFLMEDSQVEAAALGPGSLRLGILNHSAPVSELAVPAVARVRGAGAFFTSIMHLFNGGSSDLELEMTFTPRAGSGGEVTTVSHTVPAGVLQTIEDPLEALFGFSGSAGRVGSVLITVTSGSSANLMVQTVVFAQLDSGEEYGQFFPAMGAGNAIAAGQTVYLNTTEDPAHNRVNIGLMALVDGTQFRVTPVDPIGNGLAAAETYDLDTGGNTQINNIHTSFGLGAVADVVIQVEVVTGSGLAYASVLDGSGSYSGTSDPTTILPVSGGSEKVTLLEIGSIQGLNEFSGSASVTNYSEQTAAVRADFFQRDVFGVSATESLSIPAGETLGFSDLGADLFGVSGDVGSVVMSSTNGALIGATGREFAIFRDSHGEVIGTAGQLIAGQTDDDRLAAGRTYHFIGLRQERGGGAVERSHFAVFNPVWGDAQVTVRLYDGASGVLEGEASWIVDGRTLIQVNNVIRAINPGFDGNEKRIEVEVDRPVFMNAFRVNRWGDPVTLSPFPG